MMHIGRGDQEYEGFLQELYETYPQHNQAKRYFERGTAEDPPHGTPKGPDWRQQNGVRHDGTFPYAGVCVRPARSSEPSPSLNRTQMMSGMSSQRSTPRKGW
jgi:hypothetical protein